MSTTNEASPQTLQELRTHMKRSTPGLAIGEALWTRKALTQRATGELDGAPTSQTLSQWKIGRKLPNRPSLSGYLVALELDFHLSSGARRSHPHRSEAPSA